MSDHLPVPEGWTKPWLGEICQLNYGRSPKEVLAENGQFPVIGTSGVTGRSSSYLHDGPSVVVGRKGTIDSPRYVSGKFWVIDTAFYASGCRGVLPKWLYYHLCSAALEGLNEATGVPSLSREVLHALPVLLPPLPEQRKIAEVLGSVDAAIEKTERLIAKLRDLKAAMMQELLTKGLPPDVAFRYGIRKSGRMKDSPVGRIPEEWEVVRLGEVLPKGSVRNGLYKASHAYGGGVPIYRINDFQSGDALDSIPPLRVRVSDSELASFLVNEGDLLVNRVNSLSHLGKAAFVSRLPERSCFESNMMCVSLPSGCRLRSDYLRHILNSKAWRDHVLSSAKRAIAQASINQEDLRSFVLGVPSLGEQEVAVLGIGSVEGDTQATHHRLRGLHSLKKALMQDLLTGRVRVKV